MRAVAGPAEELTHLEARGGGLGTPPRREPGPANSTTGATGAAMAPPARSDRGDDAPLVDQPTLEFSARPGTEPDLDQSSSSPSSCSSKMPFLAFSIRSLR